MTIDTNEQYFMSQEDIVETLISFARNNNAIAFQNLYKQFFKDTDVSEIQRSFSFIRKSFEIAKK